MKTLGEYLVTSLAEKAGTRSTRLARVERMVLWAMVALFSEPSLNMLSRAVAGIGREF
jgi:hypothetical protein